jgi:hypothetical protein
MDGMRFTACFHVHGTLSADATFRYKLPCNATLVQVDTNGTADVTASMVLGTAADADGYLQAFAPGANATAVTKDRGDFNGALNTNTAECPHIAKDTVLIAVLTHASSSDFDLALTFLEG